MGSVATQNSNGDPFLAPSLSPAMRELDRQLANVAPTDIPVLLLGESGTGKEWVAAEIHRRSRQHNEPFIRMHCAALTPSLLNEWLCGTGQGNGANSLQRPCTVFLEEISALDPTCQSRLLLALSDGDMPPEPDCLGARVISATSQNLEEEMRAHHFREELYYRVNGVCLRLPPLRERKEDIVPLSRLFMERFAKQFKKPFRDISPPAERVLIEYPWPGNIRELRNLFERTVLLENGTVLEPIHLKLTSRSRPLAESTIGQRVDEYLTGLLPADGIPFEALVEELERGLILRASYVTKWNQSRTAELLRLKRDKLRYRMKLYQLQSENGVPTPSS